MFVFAFFAILAVPSFSYGENVFSNFVSIKQAQYYAIHQAVSLLEERDVPFDQLPAAITADLSKFVTKTDIQQAENLTGKYKVTITVDIQKIKQRIPEYWHRTTIQNKDINALFARRNALNDIMQEIDKIFADYPSQVYSGVRKGMFEVAAKDSSSENNATLEMTYEGWKYFLRNCQSSRSTPPERTFQPYQRVHRLYHQQQFL